MAVCGKCGTQMDGTVCPVCGGAASGGQDAQDNKVMGILAYLGILVLIPLFAAKESPFARYHTNQGLILLILAVAINILSYIFWPLGFLGIATFVLMIIGIVNAAKGELKPLPLIGTFTLLK